MLSVTKKRFNTISSMWYKYTLKVGDRVVWFDMSCRHRTHIEIDNPEALVVTCKRKGKLYMQFLETKRRGDDRIMIHIVRSLNVALFVVKFEDMTEEERVEYVTQRMGCYANQGNV